jgi:hypothetical protein
VHEPRKDSPEEAGPEQEAREDLTGHIGLTQATHDPGHDPGCHEDREELVEEAERDLLGARPDGRLLPTGLSMDVGADEHRGAERGQDRVSHLVGYRVGLEAPQGGSDERAGGMGSAGHDGRHESDPGEHPMLPAVSLAKSCRASRTAAITRPKPIRADVAPPPSPSAGTYDFRKASRSALITSWFVVHMP